VANAKISPYARLRFPSVSEMRDTVVICTTIERPDRYVSTIVERPGVIEVRARIRPAKAYQILNYQTVFKSASEITTVITIRMPPDVKVDINHWVYQKTGYAPSWYKVRSVEDIENQGRFLALYCTLDVLNDERSDPATQQSPPRWDDPDFPTNVTDRV
jgi:hypothetical protein